MSPEQFQYELKQKAIRLKNYAMNYFPSQAGNIALRFINGNFRAQGFQGKVFAKWKKNKRNGTTLVQSGRLRSATYYSSSIGEVTIRNNMPYAKAHNEGFKGVVSIRAHSRVQLGKRKQGTGRYNRNGKERMQTVSYRKGNSSVKAHSRKMNIAQRQFMPITETDSPILNHAIHRQVARSIEAIFT